MNVVFAVALILLTAGMILLFTMMGALYTEARAGATSLPSDQESMHVLDTALVGTMPKNWPRELAHLQEREFAAILVLSTACSSCAKIAKELSGDSTGDLPAMGLLISAPDTSTGTSFADQYGLFDRWSVAVDKSGQWSTNQCGVGISPAGLLFENGILTIAFAFNSLNVISRVTTERRRNEIKEHQ